MEGELKNLLMVWCLILISSTYCYGTTKFIPKGTTRFLLLLPVICLSFHLPQKLNTISYSNPTAFFITWQTTFKLLLLVFGNGPLCNPSLSLFHFFIIFSLPINLGSGPLNKKEKDSRPNTKNQIGLGHWTKHLIVLIILIHLGNYKALFPQTLVSFMICIYIYVGLEVLLVGAALIAQFLLGQKVDPPFDHPYLSTSLQDFWGRRWNRVTSTSLRSAVFYPTYNFTGRVLGRGRDWAVFLGLMVSFMVSDIMHEILFVYMGRVRLGWGPPLYFLMHGFLVAAEGMLKRKFDVKWKVPQLISGPLIFGFALWTFMWMVLPDLLELHVDDRVLKEYADFVVFLKELGGFGAKRAVS